MPSSEAPAGEKLALYTMAFCPFSWRVTRTIDRLGLDIEMRDVLMHPSRRAELIEACGRSTVPVLWIQSADGTVRWMPESADIVRYLVEVYG